MEKLQQLQQFLQWFWQVAKRYWGSQERFRAWGLLAAAVLFIILANNASALLNRYQGEFTTALSNKQLESFQNSLLLFGGTLLALIIFSFFENFIQNKLQLYWREWLTKDFLDRYFADRAFYQVNANKAIDNPDQRISEDIESFISSSLTYSLSLGSNVLSGFLFINILWSINKNLVFVAILTALVQTLVSFFIGRILTPLNFKNLQYQADFRYSLVHVRNNSESIAFYKGEEQEEGIVQSKFSRLLAVLHAKIFPSSLLDAINISLGFTVLIIAYLILAPQYFAGQITFGDVTRSIPAFLTIVNVFSWFARSFEGLALFAAVIKRLGTFSDYLHQNQKPAPSQSVINTLIEPRFALSHVTVKTPDRKRVLVEDFSVEVPHSEGILVMGASGSGKSSILRAVAGLWNTGEGHIYRPNTAEILFIPQRPYIVLGSLRNQILYPYTKREVSDTKLQEVLEQVNLTDLVARVEGLDVELNWADVLSLGEQQRLGFARLFLHNPHYAVLDESTSALDVANEKHLYHKLREANITYISVGHRPTLIPYHQLIVEILGQGKWRFLSPDDSKGAEAF
ncbi:ATP-binding cassette domain-containing protein [Scytonema sp. UIC 10036]|uniref:ABC transporter ATP-binding protein/permease n=1 Tax=Scytonema sp. UIC 10036 TaxID=2304196 RepID=UPI0012DABC87|nr:ABC transporter ATP-binding protein/permease [Scytonema sp. UIC 10036]MUG91361.1 ATP-binding cassette domain-containing protein [Scytonema sp. UIC 10036]